MLTGAVTDMGAITDDGETYQIAPNYNQLWVADAYNNADGQIYGMTIDDGFVWLATGLALMGRMRKC
jgi:hypothetical protein